MEEGFVYFITDGDAIKIGHATNVKKRLSSLQSGHSKRLTVLTTVSGCVMSEYSLHQRFAHLRISGEWFRPEPELADFIRELRDNPPEVPAPAPEPEPVPPVKSQQQELRETLAQWARRRPDMQGQINTLDWVLKARMEGKNYPDMLGCARMAMDSIAGTLKWEKETGRSQLEVWQRMYPDVGRAKRAA